MNDKIRRIGNAGIICGGALIVSSMIAMPVANCFNPHRNNEEVLRYGEVRSGLVRLNESEKSRKYLDESIKHTRDELGLLEKGESVRSYISCSERIGEFGLGGMIGGFIVVAATMGFMSYHLGIKMYDDWKEEKRKK